MVQNMAKEFSVKVLDNIMNNTEDWLNLFKKDEGYTSLSTSEQEDSEFIIEMFTEWHYTFDSRRPREWTKASLKYVLIDLFPAQLAFGRTFFENVEPVLTQYFLFLDKIGKIKNAQALLKELKEVSPVMIEEALTDTSLGLGQTLIDAAEEEKIEIHNGEEFQHFIAMLNQLDGHGKQKI
ncbi:hypothetical protein [Vagococcus jeotgali]|uniref:hypothetical protein n=1 Tax=Vagococcus jeotgali TaxID=3109030 RepID=UPI002DD89556|nr:hypothetical protein [Vagococcus sp. B2T-5]